MLPRHWIPIAAVFAVLILDIVVTAITRHGDKIEARLEARLRKTRDRLPRA
jgi:hypothetical protein